MAATIDDLIRAASQADEPQFPGPSTPKLGGVDPLGLRQINFDLMDQVLPGLNNVARHIRPFVVVAWASRRARQIAEAEALDRVPVDDIRDFVDRVEVIYAWSQFLRRPDSDLPGRQVLSSLINSDKYRFGGEPWKKRREGRRYSTAFTAPITYGPGLKTLGWVAPHQEHPSILIANPEVEPALNAFEALLSDRLAHPAFKQFGDVTVTSDEAHEWADAWALEEATEAEKRAMERMLLGDRAPQPRRAGMALMLAAASHTSADDANRVRGTMAGSPSNLRPPAALEEAAGKWRRVQVRQLFRLALEALFYWTMWTLEDGSRHSGELVETFLAETSDRRNAGTAREWLQLEGVEAVSVTEALGRVEVALGDEHGADLAQSIADALSFCMAEVVGPPQPFERADRLPLFRAQHEAEAWGDATPRRFLRHVFESWVLAQHVYWCVGRGLADARARGKTILRLKIVLEEEGWTLAPGASLGSAPVPTPDRLATALSLSKECGLLMRPAV